MYVCPMRGGRYASWLNDAEVNQYLETRFIVQSEEKIADFIEGQNSRSDVVFCAICLKETDEHIGNIKIGPINYHHRKGDISCFIGEKSAWGYGYGTEAMRLMLDYGFRVLDLEKICCGIYGTNVGSQRMVTKCGFVREGVLRSEVVTRAGERIDCYHYGLLREEYEARQNS